MIPKMPPLRQLLTIAAVLEGLTGLALILAPAASVVLLLGAEPDSMGLTVGRVAGVALSALAISCWGASTDSGGPDWAGTLAAITAYNAGVGLLLLLFAATGNAHGPVA